MTLTYRAVKGSALTHAELDGNFTDLDTKITNLVDFAPGALDTLNELAAALGDDANYAATITTSLAGKEPTITAGATTTYWRGDKSFQTLNTAVVPEVTNLYYTDARADARIAAADTGDLTEGTNLYYTDARADARIALQVGANLDLTGVATTTLPEGTNLYYTDARADARIVAAGSANWDTAFGWGDHSAAGYTTGTDEGSFSIQTAAFNATAGTRYGVNTTSAPVTATLPASPSAGDAIFFADAGGAYATNNLTIGRNGNTIMGSATDMVVSTNSKSIGVFYTGSDWRTYDEIIYS